MLKKLFKIIFILGLIFFILPILIGVIVILVELNSCDHYFEYNRAIIESTCTENGVDEYKCIYCNEIQERKNTDNLRGYHNYNGSSYKIIKDKTCTEDGIYEITCRDCNVVEQKVLKASHEFSDFIYDVTPTCTKGGKGHQTCEDCGFTITKEVLPLEHKFEYGKCTRCDDLKVYKAYYMIDDDTYFTKDFTIESLELSHPELPNLKGCNVKGWDVPYFNYDDLYIKLDYETIRYNINYVGVDISNNPTTYTVYDVINLERGTIYDSSKPNHLEYVFEGWYLEETFDTRINVITKGTTGDITLYAKYEIKEHLIYVNSNKYIDYFEFATLNIPLKYTFLDDVIYLPQDLHIDGYEFVGWYVDDKLSTTIDPSKKKSVTLELMFTPNKYNISLDGVDTYEKINYGEHYKLSVPSKENYKFIGWYLDDVQMTNELGNSLVEYSILGDCQLTPKFEIIKYNIKYYVNDIEYISNTVDSGSTLDVSVTPEKQEGLIFVGWFNSLDEKYGNNVKVKNNFSLYAKFVEGYEISTVEDWELIRSNPSANFQLTNEINFKGDKIEPISEFSGFLDGNGYKIKNFSIATSSVNDLYGLFIKNNGTIQNLLISDFTGNINLNQKSNCNIGIIVGENNGTLSNITISEANVAVTIGVTNKSLTCNTGMVVGVNKGTINEVFATINGQFNTTMNQNDNNKGTTYYRIGGLCAVNSGTISYSGITTTSSVNQKTTGSLGGGMIRILSFAHTVNTFGGLVAQNKSTGVIDCSYSNAILTYTSNTTYYYATSSSGSGLLHTDKLNMGALAGENIENAKISNSYTSGVVSGSANVSQSHSGGLVGLNNGSASVKSCYSMTDVISGGTQNDGSSTFGGFVGHNNATIANCYSTGNIESTVNSMVGGFAGNNNNGGTISKSYSTGNVKAALGYSHKVVGKSSGIINKIYSITSSIYTNGGSEKTTYNNGYEEIDFNLLLTNKYLKDQLFWDEEGWYIGTDNNPFLLWEIEYSHDFVQTIVKPTCLKPGFTVYECIDCNKIFLTDIVEPLGHSPQGEPFKVENATHTTDGYEMYVCEHKDSCDSENLQYSVILEALGHDTLLEVNCDDDKLIFDDGNYYYQCSCEDLIKIDSEFVVHEPKNVEYKAPTCSSVDENGQRVEAQSGITQGSICGKCEIVLFGCLEIEPHNLVFKQELETATCDKDGKAIYKCKVCADELELSIPATGHNYNDTSYECTICGANQYEIDASYYPISNPEDLNQLTANPFGKYYLTKDIDLSNYSFKSLCSDKIPFNGILLGNGFKIKNLVISKNNVTSTNVAFITSIGENGVLVGLTFENVYISVKSNVTDSNYYSSSNSITNNVSVITANNSGKIYRCNVLGDVDISISSYVNNNSTKDISKSFYLTYGTIAANNNETGKIIESSVKGTVSLHYTFEANLESHSVSSTLQHLLSVTKAENITEMISGGIVGVNKGLISHTTFEPTLIHTMGRVSSVADRGKSSLIVNLYDGGFVGMNYGEIMASKSVAIKNNIHSADYNSFVYDYPIVIKNVVIKSEYMAISDYSILGYYPGVIGYNNNNNVEITTI